MVLRGNWDRSRILQSCLRREGTTKKSPVICAGFLTFLALQVTGGRETRFYPQIKENRQPASISSFKVNRKFGRMPVYFIPNRGQMDEQVAYYVQGKDKTVYFTDEGVTFSLAKAKEKSEAPNNRSSALRPRGMDERNFIRLHSWEGIEGPYEDPEKLERESGYERWVVKLDFVGANPDAHPAGLEETGTTISYFKGKPEEWKAGLPAYSKVIYRGLWPGIDLVYHGTVNRLKYEFIVHPGADPSQIRLSYRGAESVSVDESGRLQVMTPMGGFSDDVPVAYQEIDVERRNIELAYKIELSEDAKAKTVSYGFEVGDYDRNLPLVLDPAILIYCGFIGGARRDYGRGIAVDAVGCAYVTGETLSYQDTFPAAVGPDLIYNGGGLYAGDAFVAKVNASGTALLYCGYIGGFDNDRGKGIAVDGVGCAYVVGGTDSSQSTFPVIVGPDITLNGGLDAFVAKVNSSGTALDYCGYIGGSGGTVASRIAVDSAGCAYVTGDTNSSEATFPVAVGPDLTYNGSCSDAFVAKVNAEGSALVYCGYIGGSSLDYGRGIAVDGAGCAYVTGFTYTSDATFPVIVGPDLSYNGVATDGFVAKVSAAGTELVYCGYIGGKETDLITGVEECVSIAVDSSGCAYVAGHERWCDEIEFQEFYYSNPYVVKIQASGESFIYDFPISSGLGPVVNAISVDAAGCVYVGAQWGSYDDLPGFLAKINAAGTAFIYSEDFEGSISDIAIEEAGDIYVTGSIYSRYLATFSAKVGPDLIFNGLVDAFVAKISPEYFGYCIFGGHDYDGDGASDIAVWRPSDGIWYIRGIDTDKWGRVNDIPVPGDYNGDGFTDIAVWRPYNGVWYIRGIDNDKLGQVGDVPVPKDYDGDGRTDLAVWRPSDGT
jgi:hypothetical protein